MFFEGIRVVSLDQQLYRWSENLIVVMPQFGRCAAGLFLKYRVKILQIRISTFSSYLFDRVLGENKAFLGFAQFSSQNILINSAACFFFEFVSKMIGADIKVF